MHIKSGQNIGIPIQFFLSYCLVGIFVAVILKVLTALHIGIFATIISAGMGGGLTGLLLTWNIQSGLVRIERALYSIKYGLVVERLETGWQWPLNTLFERVRQIRQTLEEYTRRELLSSEQHEQLLQTVREAAAQEERNRLARELHDSIKQLIFSIGMSAAAIEERLAGGSGAIATPLTDIQQSVGAAQSEMEALVQQLRPATLSMTGIIENLQAQCQAMAYRIQGQAMVEIGQLPAGERLAPATGDTLQRIIQEALSNIARHARARHVRLYITQQEDMLLIEVHDDGQGFAVNGASHGMGLANMQARANALGGNLHIQSQPGKTVVAISLPLLVLASDQLSQERQVINTRLQQARSLHGNADFLVQLAGLCILLALPFAFVGAGLVLAILCVGLAYRHRQVIWRLTGKTRRENLLLLSREYETVSGLLMIFGLCAWYAPVARPEHWPVILTVLLCLISLAIVLLALLACWKYRRTLTAYAERLLPGEREHEARTRRLQAQTRLVIWLLIVLLEILIGQPDLAFPPHTLDQWSGDASIALLLFWPVLELAIYTSKRFWKFRPALAE